MYKILFLSLLLLGASSVNAEYPRVGGYAGLVWDWDYPAGTADGFVAECAVDGDYLPIWEGTETEVTFRFKDTTVMQGDNACIVRAFRETDIGPREVSDPSNEVTFKKIGKPSAPSALTTN